MEDLIAEAKLEWLKREVEKGYEGTPQPWDPEEIKREGRRRLAAERARKSGPPGK